MNDWGASVHSWQPGIGIVASAPLFGVVIGDTLLIISSFGLLESDIRQLALLGVSSLSSLAGLKGRLE